MVEDIIKFRKNTVKMNKIEIMNRERIFKPSQEKTEFLEIDLTKKNKVEVTIGTLLLQKIKRIQQIEA